MNLVPSRYKRQTPALVHYRRLERADGERRFSREKSKQAKIKGTWPPRNAITEAKVAFEAFCSKREANWTEEVGFDRNKNGLRWKQSL
jgi:hypothetical protein